MTRQHKALLEAVQAWLDHANEDLDMARRALQPPTRVKGACGHAHLAVEMALKGYLTWLGVERPERSHDLVELGEEAEANGAGGLAVEDLRLMNRFAPPLRYPDKPTPSAEDALAAVRLAERLVTDLRNRMDLP
jgi:HEPN domain-containing protein